MNLQARLSVQEGKNRESLQPGRTLEFCAGEFKPASFKAGRTLPHYFTYDRIISGESHLRLLHLSCSRGSGVAEQDLFFHDSTLNFFQPFEKKPEVCRLHAALARCAHDV